MPCKCIHAHQVILEQWWWHHYNVIQWRALFITSDCGALFSTKPVVVSTLYDVKGDMQIFHKCFPFVLTMCLKSQLAASSRYLTRSQTQTHSYKHAHPLPPWPTANRGCSNSEPPAPHGFCLSFSNHLWIQKNFEGNTFIHWNPSPGSEKPAQGVLVSDSFNFHLVSERLLPTTHSHTPTQSMCT